ncbi:MAG: hypothetical protein AAF959_16995, partial [Cyanobacteria bacterium P01_D01_bin.56]
ITSGLPPSKTATQLFVVPKSMPITFPIGEPAHSSKSLYFFRFKVCRYTQPAYPQHSHFEN